jgi:hypothetical protein
MKLTIEIPDDIGIRLSESGGDLSRRALEAFALAEFRAGRVDERDLLRILGFGTRWRLDGFLKSHGIYDDYTLEDFERERQTLKDFFAREQTD